MVSIFKSVKFHHLTGTWTVDRQENGMMSETHTHRQRKISKGTYLELWSKYLWLNS